MKKPLKDRIDILIESARNGNSVAQLKLSKCFYKGILLRSPMRMRYTGHLKPCSAGVPEAESYYNAIT